MRHNLIISNCWFYSFLKCHFLDGCSCFLRGAVLSQGRGCVSGGLSLHSSWDIQLHPQPTNRGHSSPQSWAAGLAQGVRLSPHSLLTACSQPQDGCSTNPADFPEHQGLLETSAPRGVGQSHSQSISSSAQRHSQRPCYPPSQSLLDRALFKWTHIGSLSAFRCSCNFWKCCSWQKPWGSWPWTGCHSCQEHILTRVWCAECRGTQDLHHIQTTSSSLELPISLKGHLNSLKHSGGDNNTSTCPGTAALWQQQEDSKKKRKMTRAMDAKMNPKMSWFPVGRYLCLRALVLMRKATYSLMGH